MVSTHQIMRQAVALRLRTLAGAGNVTDGRPGRRVEDEVDARAIRDREPEAD